MVNAKLLPTGRQKVGLAPGTTTMQFGYQGRPAPSRQAKRAAKIRDSEVLIPYATSSQLRNGLGDDAYVVHQPHAWMTGQQVSRPSMAIHVPMRMMKRRESAGLGLITPTNSWQTGRQVGPPSMALFWRGGEPHLTPLRHAPLGLTSDEVNRNVSGLGTIPNDDELAIAYGGGYTPVHSGWVYGYDSQGKPYYESGFYDAASDAAAMEAEAMGIAKTQTWLQAISTVAVATIAITAVAAAVSAYKKSR
jgi:hypothetical protein